MPANVCKPWQLCAYGALLLCCLCVIPVQSLRASDAGSEPPWKVLYGLAFSKTQTKAVQGFSPSTSESNVQSLTIQRQLTPGFQARVGVVGLKFRVRDDLIEPGFTEASFLDWKSVGLKAGFSLNALGFDIRGSVLGAGDKYRLTRSDQIAGAIAESRSKGWHIYTDITVGGDIWLADWLLVRPTAALQHSFTHVRAFTERGAGLSNLNVGKINDERIRSDIGLVVSAVLPLETNGVLTPFVGARWAHNFMTGPFTAQSSSVVLGDLGDTPIARGPEADGVNLTGGFFWKLPFGSEFTVAYTGEFFKSSQSHSVAGVLGFPF